jgi:hypothetical protein
MTGRSFSLTPFPAPNIPDISITGEISLQENILHLSYSLTGKLDDIFLPPASMTPSRKDELWKTTCFEFFLAIKDQPHYWEFNMSSSGDWNVYYMDAYRRVGFREETSIEELACEVQNTRASKDPQTEPSGYEAGIIHLNATVDLNSIVPQNQLLEFGITAIIQTANGKETYWALVHPAPFADFHLRESFILELAEPTPLSQQSALAD